MKPDRSVWSTLILALIATKALFPAAAFAQGCAMCATGIGGPNDPLARGMNASILFLMSMPFALVGSVGAWFFYMYRRAERLRRSFTVLGVEKEVES